MAHVDRRPVVWGWYLWHWPLIVMARQTFGHGLAISIGAAAFALIPTMVSFDSSSGPSCDARKSSLLGG
jgi:hypothetical protein